ncbi:MAG: hypothetical protein JWO48_3380 [Bryobacterales bacterium]|nr:hypothetical protein [Bryobacterales bacterium]
MAAENITELIDSLTPEEQETVREFIRFLKSKNETPTSPFLAAVDNFVKQHPELLRRLAQ